MQEIIITGLGKKIANKKGGVHKGDPYCGLYKNNDNRYLVKRDGQNPANDVAEYLSAKIFHCIAPGYGAEINLMNLEENTYITSTYFKNYQDLSACAGYAERPVKMEFFESILGRNQYVKNELLSKDSQNKYIYQDYEKAIVTSLLLGDFSVHSGNLGVVSRNNRRELVRIDFGAALRSFTIEIKLFHSIKNRMGFEKNYLRRDHPVERIFCIEFCNELRRVAQINLDELVTQEWEKVKTFFNKQCLEQFARRIEDAKRPLKLHEVGNFLCERIKKRQISLLHSALEIELVLIIKTHNENHLKQFLAQRSKLEFEWLEKIMTIPAVSELFPAYTKEIQAALLKMLGEARQIQEHEAKKRLLFFKDNSLQAEMRALEELETPHS